ncbi:hypothetical protein ACVBEF_06425 [Glaciimonas sp. GG7]
MNTSPNQLGLPNAVPTMESAIESIIGRTLTDEEAQMLIRLRDRYGYDDGDPLIPVLAMLGAHKILVEEVPKKITDATEKAIELHRSVLRDQSMFVAKDLVGNIAGLVHASGKSRVWDRMWGFASGVILVLVIAVVLKVLKYF